MFCTSSSSSQFSLLYPKMFLLFFIIVFSSIFLLIPSFYKFLQLINLAFPYFIFALNSTPYKCQPIPHTVFISFLSLAVDTKGSNEKTIDIMSIVFHVFQIDTLGTRLPVHNHLVCKWTLNHLAKMAKWLSCVVSTYLYIAFDCIFLSCHIRVLAWTTLCSCLNIKNRRNIWSLSDCNGNWNHNHLVRKRTINGWVFVYELSGCGFEFRCSNLNFSYHTCFEQRLSCT